jgi:polyhydroxyalkanoate synthase
MSKQPETLEDREDLGLVVQDIAETSRRLLEDFTARKLQNGVPSSPDPLNLSHAIFDLTTRMISQPAALMQANLALWQEHLGLMQTTARRMIGGGERYIEPAKDDRRFRDPAWEESIVFDFVKQSYLLTSRWLLNMINEFDGFDPKTHQKLDFYTRQFIDAMSPTNFVATNPEVLRLTLESNGENLIRGFRNLLQDLERGKGKLQIRMTDLEAFELGRNVALTPGKVVYRNDLMELLQYTPSTKQVYRRPLLIVPPWINKFYILDLQPKNSFIKYAVDQGYTVFVISWVNPDETYAQKSFEDYMQAGPLAALDAVEQATGEREVTSIGYCLGGTLLASTIAYLKAHRRDPVKAATFFTTMTDFSNAGELGVFIEKEQLDTMEAIMAERGYLDGSEMATTFSFLRANDLVWSFVINNYLLGKDPFPFDLLYWNSDSTRMPYSMHSYYLREFYLNNKLVKPGEVQLCGTGIDLGQVDVPTYLLSTREDHIAPWISTYAATQLYKGDITFVLAGSGHIAGVINPPTSNKYGYWTNDALPAEPEVWLEAAEHNPGSWWPHWSAWNGEKSGDMVPARQPGDGKLEVLEDAPGSYVKMRAA